MESASPHPGVRAWPIWLPCAALVPVGVLARLDAPPTIAIGSAVTAVALAAVAFAWAVARLATRRVPRRVGITAIVVNVTLLAITGAAVARGVVERKADDARADELRNAQAAARDLGGWIGGAGVGDARIQATQIDPSSELGRMLGDPFTERFIPVVFTIENRGAQELVADSSSVSAQHADGTQRPALDRARVLASARDNPEELKARHPGVYRVPAGARLGSGLVFVAPDERFDDVVALTLSVDGRPIALRGRFLTADQKRAMREHAPPR